MSARAPAGLESSCWCSATHLGLTRDPFPDEDGSENDPEETKAFPLREDRGVSVEGVEEVDNRQ